MEEYQKVQQFISLLEKLWDICMNSFLMFMVRGHSGPIQKVEPQTITLLIGVRKEM
jgi:hypothetical protein